MKTRSSFFAVSLSLVLATAALAQVPPEKAVQTFKVSDGLEIALWASEPLLVNPTCMDIDHKSRVWICESINYRQKLRGQKVMRRPEGDRILILEDTKGAGKADKVTVFYQAPEIHAPLGIAVLPHTDGLGCTVYVCQSPDIFVFEDKDGDGKADGPPRKLLTGFNGLDHDHGVHGILIGPDNRLYFTVGDTGVRDLKSSDGKGPKFNSNSTDCRAATVWRCDLDGKNLELIAHNFRNNYEPCVDSFGTVFLSDNDDDGNQQTRICYVMPGGDHGYHRNPKTSHWNEEHPGIVPKILRTYFGSPTGICFYEGKLFPKQYQEQLFHVDAGPRHARCYHLTPKGAAFSAEQENMVESTDNWFRPSDICIAPDGSAYIADWYDPGVGGHGMGDVKMGRVFRLAPAGNKASVPPLDLTSKEGLTAALASPNLAVRAAAMAKLRELGLPKALAILEPAAVQKDNVVLRARALWQLGYMGNLRHVTQAFEDPDPRFRILAMRILHDAKGQSPIDYISDWQTRLLKDPSAAVRREGLLLLRNADPEKAAPLIYSLARQYDGKDRFYLCAVGIAVGHHDPKRREIILADFDKQFSEWNEKVAGLIWEVRPPQMLAVLNKVLDDNRTPLPQRLQIVDIIATSGNPNAGRILLKTLAADPLSLVSDAIVFQMKQHLADKWNDLRKEPELGALAKGLLENPSSREKGLVLAGAGQVTDALPQILKIAKDNNENISVRRLAIQSLSALPARDVAKKVRFFLGNKDQPMELRQDAITALGRLGTSDARDDLIEIAWAAGMYSLAERQAAVAALVAHKDGAISLLEGYSRKALNADLTPDLSRLLRNSPFQDVKNLANKLLPAPPKLDPKKLPSIPALLARKGNAERGKQFMALTIKNDAACLKCHVINKTGGNVGPELSVIGSKVSRENLLESLLYPSRAIADQYIQWIIETKGGLVINGVIAEETPEHLLLRDVNAKEHKILKKDIEERKKSANSIMPDNLLLFMSEDDLLDMVEYLYSLKSPPLGPVSRLLEEPQGPRLTRRRPTS